MSIRCKKRLKTVKNGILSKDNKGQFQKGNKAAKKVVSKTRYLKHTTRVPEAPRERPLNQLNDVFIPYGVNNDYGSALASIARKSPVHRALITSKTRYITGSNFLTEIESLKKFLDASNEKETFRDVHRKLIRDKLQSGNAYWQVIHDSSGNLLKSFHIDYTKCRLSASLKDIIIHPDWSRYQTSRKEAVTIPIFPDFTVVDGLRVSMVHIKDYEPEFSHYGIPSSIAGLDSAGIAYKTNKWNISRLDNDFKTSGVLIIDSDFSDQDAIDFQKDFDNEFTGEGKQGKVLMIQKNVGEGRESTNFIPISNASEGDWINLHKQSSDELVIAHNWFRSLSGLSEAGSLGSTQQIRNEYKIALNTVVNDEQTNLISVYNNIFEAFGIGDENLSIFNKPIIELTDIDINEILTLIEKHKAGDISKEAVLKLMQISGGISKEEATILIS